MTRRRYVLFASAILLLAVGLALVPVGIEYKDKLKGKYGDGTIRGEATITLLNDKNEVVAGTLINFFSGISPEIREEYLWCKAQEGMTWVQDPYGEGGTCEPLPPPPDPVEPETPPPPVTKDTGEIPPPPVVYRDIQASKVTWFKFKLEWVEIEARNIDKATLRVIMKVRGLLNDESWSAVIEREEIKASDNEFQFTKIDEERWRARADSNSIKDNEVGINIKDQFTSKYNEKIPVTFFSYYYATGQSTLDGLAVESEHIESVTTIKDSSLGLTGGMILLPSCLFSECRRLKH